MTRDCIEGLVSTIIPVYNRPRLLVEAVESVIAQDYRQFEIVIVDDGSTDGTAAVADSLARSLPARIAVLRQPNGGPGVARESGRRAARGEFLQYLDSDDVVLPGKFSCQVAALRARPDAGVAYGYTRYRHADGRAEALPWKGSGTAVASMFPSFLESRWWDTPNPLYRASVCESAGPWTDLRLEEDWEYDCRIASAGVALVHCPQFVAEVRDHGDHRLGRGAAQETGRLASRTRAHGLILKHALSARIPVHAPERRHFARELFLLARQCGAAGLTDESRQLFNWAKVASGDERAGGIDFRFYRAASGVLGWRLTGSIACAIDRLRR